MCPTVPIVVQILCKIYFSKIELNSAIQTAFNADDISDSLRFLRIKTSKPKVDCFGNY
jgi:hypothetical protein